MVNTKLYVLLTFRVSFSMLTTILVSSHCTLWAMWTSWCSSRASGFSQGRLLNEGGGSSGGGNGKGRLERAPSPGWGLVCRRMENSGGNMLCAGSTTSGWHSCMIRFHHEKELYYRIYSYRITWLSQLDTEVVSHRSVGVRCDGIVATLHCPLDQGLWSWWQPLPGGFHHLH